jgi:hypothetical protein
VVVERPGDGGTLMRLKLPIGANGPNGANGSSGSNGSA